MSANDGIYILETADGFRVRYASAIDNICSWDSANWCLNPIPKMVDVCFGSCKVYMTRQEAMDAALTIRQTYKTEYGILFIQWWKDETFFELIEKDNNDRDLYNSNVHILQNGQGSFGIKQYSLHGSTPH